MQRSDVPTIDAIINDAARVYRDVIPTDCWHDPYMSRSELLAEIAAGVAFWGREEADTLVGVMGLQTVHNTTLIRHAYVRPASQGGGIGGALLTMLAADVTGPLLCWSAPGRRLIGPSASMFGEVFSTFRIREKATPQVLLDCLPASAGMLGGAEALTLCGCALRDCYRLLRRRSLSKTSSPVITSPNC
jgi:hypothetical protein